LLQNIFSAALKLMKFYLFFRSQVPEGLPDFPDSHSYIRTPTHKQPQADYESVREKASSQKRDVERALTRFIAKTCGKTHSLFNTDDTNVFPLISSADTTVHAELFNTNLAAEAVGSEGLQVPTYINALIFRDQIFEEDEREYLPKKSKKSDPNEKKEADSDDEKEESSSPSKDTTADAAVEAAGATATKAEVVTDDHNKPIDNPFLRQSRMPRSALCLPSACK
jgi:hypothetical protein